MKRKQYNRTIKAEAKFLYVEKELSSLQISRQFNNSPTAQCIDYWSKLKDKSSGLTWREERALKSAEAYKQLSPQNQANQIMKMIDKILNTDFSMLDPKALSSLADALRKTQRSMEYIVNKDFQIPMLFEFLTKLVEFVNSNYKHLLTTDFKNAVKHFKNNMIKNLQSPNSMK